VSSTRLIKSGGSRVRESVSGKEGGGGREWAELFPFAVFAGTSFTGGQSSNEPGAGSVFFESLAEKGTPEFGGGGEKGVIQLGGGSVLCGGGGLGFEVF